MTGCFGRLCYSPDAARATSSKFCQSRQIQYRNTLCEDVALLPFPGSPQTYILSE